MWCSGSDVVLDYNDSWPRGYKTVNIRYSTEHEISAAHKIGIPTFKKFLAFESLRCCIYNANKC